MQVKENEHFPVTGYHYLKESRGHADSLHVFYLIIWPICGNHGISLPTLLKAYFVLCFVASAAPLTARVGSCEHLQAW